MAEHEQRRYHETGMRWYGRTKYGTYLCPREADAARDSGHAKRSIARMRNIGGGAEQIAKN